MGKRLTQDIDPRQEVPGIESHWQTIVGVVEDLRSMDMVPELPVQEGERVKRRG